MHLKPYCIYGVRAYQLHTGDSAQLQQVSCSLILCWEVMSCSLFTQIPSALATYWVNN